MANITTCDTNAPSSKAGYIDSNSTTPEFAQLYKQYQAIAKDGYRIKEQLLPLTPAPKS